MSNLEIAKRMADMLESRDLKGLEPLLADDFKAKGPTLELNKHRTLSSLQILFTAFPDHRFSFTEFEQKEDLILCSGQETGTHTGVLDLTPFGMPLTLLPTGKSIKLPKCIFTFSVAGGQVTYYSEEAIKGGGLAGILEQLGVKLP